MPSMSEICVSFFFLSDFPGYGLLFLGRPTHMCYAIPSLCTALPSPPSPPCFYSVVISRHSKSGTRPLVNFFLSFLSAHLLQISHAVSPSPVPKDAATLSVRPFALSQTVVRFVYQRRSCFVFPAVFPSLQPPLDSSGKSPVSIVFTASPLFPG